MANQLLEIDDRLTNLEWGSSGDTTMGKLSNKEANPKGNRSEGGSPNGKSSVRPQLPPRHNNNNRHNQSLYSTRSKELYDTINMMKPIILGTLPRRYILKMDFLKNWIPKRY